MSRYIDADNLIIKMDRWYEKMCLKYGETDQFNMGYAEGITAIENAPSADVVEVRHGEWIDDNTWSADMLHYRCSICGNYEGCKTNFCSNCGAKMDGERSEK